MKYSKILALNVHQYFKIYLDLNLLKNLLKGVSITFLLHFYMGHLQVQPKVHGMILHHDEQLLVPFQTKFRLSPICTVAVFLENQGIY